MTTRPVEELLLGESDAMRRLRGLVRRIGPTDIPVLIEGPTGVGKELVAQALHSLSRRHGAMVALNVAAIPDAMFEASVFGHVRGAFTGAVGDNSGFVSEAHGGSLFLDEIGSLPMGLQPKLLRVLETRQYRPVGARTDRASDFRLIAASNTSLLQSVREGSFRADLHHRIAAITIQVPALRERVADVEILARHFLQSFAMRHHRRVSLLGDAIATLEQYAWPGNVRELRSVVEAAIVMSEGDEVTGADVRRLIDLRLAVAESDDAREAQRGEIVAALARHDGDTHRVAEELEVNRATVYRWMQQMGIRTPRKVRRNGSSGLELGA